MLVYQKWMLREVLRIITAADIKKKCHSLLLIHSFSPMVLTAVLTFIHYLIHLENWAAFRPLVSQLRCQGSAVVLFKLWSQVLSSDAEAEHGAGDAGGDKRLRVSKSQGVGGHADPGPDALSCPLPLLQGTVSQPLVLRGTINTFTTILLPH